MLNETLLAINQSQPLNIVLTSTTNWSQYAVSIVLGSLGILFYLYLMIKSGSFSLNLFSLAGISRLTKKSVLMIKHTEQGFFSQSMINEESLREISNILNKFEGRDFDLILHTPGGDVFSTLAISRLFNQYPGKIRGIIPLYAMSGGSMLALTCDEILMTKNASIGPIDPQLGSFFKYGSSKSWNEIVKFKGKKAEDQTISFAMTGKQYTQTIKAHLLNVIDFNLSSEQKEKLTQFLTAGDIEHAYALTPMDLEKFGMKVTILEDKKLLKMLEKIISSRTCEGINCHLRKN